MKYNIRGNKIDVTEAISDYIKNKVSKLEKYLDDNDEVEAHIQCHIVFQYLYHIHG